jgi:hypothetical protein
MKFELKFLGNLKPLMELWINNIFTWSWTILSYSFEDYRNIQILPCEFQGNVFSGCLKGSFSVDILL